jgi:hypothetical protein
MWRNDPCPGTYHTGVAVIPLAEHLTAFVRNISTRMEHGNIIRHWKTVFIELIKEYNPKTGIEQVQSMKKSFTFRWMHDHRITPVQGRGAHGSCPR